MKMIQSFWSGGKNILSDSFGWYSSQYHLMSWALSCLQLKQFYPDVELYTDAEGYCVLIEKLNLPYTKVHVVLDELNCYPSQLWALGKIKTYERQNTPFIHVDGDVFIWKCFDENLQNAPLIAQNLEKATDYYKSKFRAVQKSLSYLHPIIDFAFSSQSACSCNAGIIGGTDVAFFKKYASEVFDFVKKNDLSLISPHTLVDFNILFEQVLFYYQVQAEGKEVTPLFSTIFSDNGYRYEDIADFTSVPFQNTYLHLIGPHKRNKTAPDLLARTLLRDHPDYYFLIVSLFDEFFQQGSTNTNIRNPAGVSAIGTRKLEAAIPVYSNKEFPDGVWNSFDKNMVPPERLVFMTDEAKKYKESLLEIIAEFRTIPVSSLLKRDVQSMNGFSFFYESKDIQLSRILLTEPLLKIIDTVFDWTLFQKEEVESSHFAKFVEASLVRMACIPEADHPYYREVVLEDLDYYIICLAEASDTLQQILNGLEACFDPVDIKNNYDKFFQLILMKIKFLIVNKCLTIV